MVSDEKVESSFMHRFIPEPGQVIELHDDSGNVKAITWVEDTLGYSMNGCFKVRDKAGKVRLITKSRQSRIVPRWRAV